MTDLVELMTAPFVACVVLMGMHAYLGIHVIERKVIFVDLALAQIAALGATFSFLLGMSPHGRGAYFFALGFAIVGAAIFALTRMRHERIPQEAIIGIVYAVALASAILVADRAPEGAEHIKETLVGAVLWITWPTVIKTTLIYVLVGALHVVLRKRFLQISLAPAQAFAERRWVRLWDFVFYVTFALVITFSVRIAGVLLVFTFLVIPAVIATLFASRIAVRLAIGWAVGIAASLVGLVASYRLDMPSGPAVVVAFGLALVLAALVYYIRASEKRGSALLRVAAGVGLIVGLLAAGGVLVTGGRFAQIGHEHDWEQAADHAHRDAAPQEGPWGELIRSCEGEPQCMAARLADRLDWPKLLSTRLADADPEIRERAVELAGHLEDARCSDLLASAAGRETDPLIRLRAVAVLVERDDRRGLSAAVELLAQESPPLVRDEAHQLLIDHAGQDFGYDPFADGETNAAAVARWRAWIEQARPRS